MIDPLKDGISRVELLRVSGTDLDVVNAARVSLGTDSNWEWEFEGKVYPTSKSVFTENVKLVLNVDNFTRALEIVGQATRVLSEKDQKLIKYLLKHKHGSPFEHNLIQFRVKCPIFVDRQMVRHRVGVSKNEVSARYVEVKEEFYVPQEFRKQAPTNRQASTPDDGTLHQDYLKNLADSANTAAYGYYQALLAQGVTREQARGVLPLNTYTESIYTFNLRSLLHFLDLRDHEGAQWETREVAKAMRELAYPHFKYTFDALEDLHVPS